MDQKETGQRRITIEKSQSFTLYDNIINDVCERQIEANLLGFIESRKLYEEIVAQGKEKIDSQFHERKKVLDGKARIHHSSLINRHHMMKNELRHKMCQEVFTAVLHRIQDQITQDQDEHCLMLIKFIVEGALRMFEPELQVRCLSKHAKIVEKVLGAAEETFNHVMEEQTGRNYPIKLRLNKTDTLKERQLDQKLDHEEFTKRRQDQECIGGVILSDLSGNITYKNTIDTRVNILKEIALPVMRVALWPSYKELDANNDKEKHN